MFRSQDLSSTFEESQRAMAVRCHIPRPGRGVLRRKASVRRRGSSITTQRRHLRPLTGVGRYTIALVASPPWFSTSVAQAKLGDNRLPDEFTFDGITAAAVAASDGAMDDDTQGHPATCPREIPSVLRS